MSTIIEVQILPLSLELNSYKANDPSFNLTSTHIRNFSKDKMDDEFKNLIKSNIMSQYGKISSDNRYLYKTLESWKILQDSPKKIRNKVEFNGMETILQFNIPIELTYTVLLRQQLAVIEKGEDGNFRIVHPSNENIKKDYHVMLDKVIQEKYALVKLDMLKNKFLFTCNLVKTSMSYFLQPIAYNISLLRLQGNLHNIIESILATQSKIPQYIKKSETDKGNFQLSNLEVFLANPKEDFGKFNGNSGETLPKYIYLSPLHTTVKTGSDNSYKMVYLDGSLEAILTDMRDRLLILLKIDQNKQSFYNADVLLNLN
jgi:hypothetical protein